jgi:glycosidase
MIHFTGWKSRSLRFIPVALACLLVTAAAQQPPARDVSSLSARQVADWIKGAVVYEIYPRTFSPEGNFAAVTRRLPDLKELGVTIIWLMPIHPIGQEKKKGTIGSPYAVRDYYGINPAYGTEADLKRLVGAAHNLGMRVIIDIVANHTAWDSVLMSKPDFYRRDAAGTIVSPYDWTDVAALDYRNAPLRDYMIGMLKHWLREFDLDGFRCDVAGEVPTDFWERARTELQEIKPDVLLLAEADKPELMVRAFDLDYAWPFHSAITNVFANGAPATEIRKTWERDRARYPRGALHMRFWDNHDEDRAIARFGKRGALAASALVLTMDGVPLLFQGAEAGDATESGAPALFENLPVFWQISERRPEFLRFYRQMLALRSQFPAFRQGETIWLQTSDDSRIIAYARRASSEEFIVAINASNRPFAGTLKVSNPGLYSEFSSSAELLSTSTVARGTTVVLPGLSLEAWGCKLYRRISR